MKQQAEQLTMLQQAMEETIKIKKALRKEKIISDGSDKQPDPEDQIGMDFQDLSLEDPKVKEEEANQK